MKKYPLIALASFFSILTASAEEAKHSANIKSIFDSLDIATVLASAASVAGAIVGVSLIVRGVKLARQLINKA